MKFKTTRNLSLIATVLALVVIMLGAYTRLEHAGLGCPDWPGCYGNILVPMSETAIASANEAFPERPVEAGKAWIEMVHRYFASALGLLIVIINIIAWRNKKRGHIVFLPTVILALVIFQGLLGMWTVTMKLDPRVVMSHLLGGFTLVSLLFLLSMRLAKFRRHYRIPKKLVTDIRPWAIIGIAALAIQIMLGGWTSANYASYQCHGVDSLPICQGNWGETMNIKEGFNVLSLKADNYEGGVMDASAREAIHVMHRIGAIVVTLLLGFLILKLRQTRNQILRDLGALVGIILTGQLLLGISNVVFGLPLLVATGHNLVGAILLLALVAVNFVLWNHKRR
jgi:heme a synthase